MKRYIKSSNSDDDYEYPQIFYRVYEIDEDEDELDFVEQFDSEADAIAFAKSSDIPVHVVFVPEVDPDDDPEYAEYIEYNYNYEPYEVIWSSLDGTNSTRS